MATNTPPTPPAEPAEDYDAFLVRVGVPPIDMTGVVYDSHNYTTAVERLWVRPRTLTLDDVKQFTLVDPELGLVARARQLGWKAPPMDEEGRKTTVSLPFFVEWIKSFLTPMLASYKFKNQQLRGDLDVAAHRLDAWEQTVARLQERVLELELEARAAATAKHATTYDDLGFPHATADR